MTDYLQLAQMREREEAENARLQRAVVLYAEDYGFELYKERLYSKKRIQAVSWALRMSAVLVDLIVVAGFSVWGALTIQFEISATTFVFWLTSLFVLFIAAMFAGVYHQPLSYRLIKPLLTQEEAIERILKQRNSANKLTLIDDTEGSE